MSHMLGGGGGVYCNHSMRSSNDSHVRGSRGSGFGWPPMSEGCCILGIIILVVVGWSGVVQGG